MNSLSQLLVVFIVLILVSKFLRLSLWGAVTLATSPFVLFYNFSLLALILSIIFGVIFHKIIHSDTTKKKFPVIFILIVTVISLQFVGHKAYFDTGITNVANSQRGEHQNYESNLLAKLLHNKTIVFSYYLKNLSDNLSPVSIFASGQYRDFSKFLPLGFLFPWYLIVFILSARQSSQNYANITSLGVLLLFLLLIGYLDWRSSVPFVFGLVWFISLESVQYLEKLSCRTRYMLSTVNLIYLLLFLLPVNVVWNI